MKKPWIVLALLALGAVLFACPPDRGEPPAAPREKAARMAPGDLSEEQLADLVAEPMDEAPARAPAQVDPGSATAPEPSEEPAAQPHPEG